MKVGDEVIVICSGSDFDEQHGILLNNSYGAWKISFHATADRPKQKGFFSEYWLRVVPQKTFDFGD